MIASVGAPQVQPRSTRRIAVTIATVLAGLLVAVLALTGAPSTPSAAQDIPTSDCPAMTDSIRRLYRGYFNREPDTEEFNRWTTGYRTGGFSLEQIAEALAATEEFRDRYGATSDERFVELVYRNTLRTEPDPTRRQHWVDTLAAGALRGSVMVAVSESEDFVERTNTATPLAGFLRWYPEGTHWYCGAGSRNDLSVDALEGDNLRADFLFHNGGAASSEFALYTVERGDRNARMASGILAAGHTQYSWDGGFTGDGFYGEQLDIIASDRTSWIVVFYQNSLGADRKGWQIGAGIR